MISTINRNLIFFKWSRITLFLGNFEPPKICLRKDFNFSHVWTSLIKLNNIENFYESSHFFHVIAFKHFIAFFNSSEDQLSSPSFLLSVTYDLMQFLDNLFQFYNFKVCKVVKPEWSSRYVVVEYLTVVLGDAWDGGGQVSLSAANK